MLPCLHLFTKMVKVSSVPARNRLKFLPTFQSGFSGLLQGKHWSQLGHIIFIPALCVFQCHHNSSKAYQQVSMDVADWCGRSWFPASSRQPSSTQGSQTWCPCSEFPNAVGVMWIDVEGFPEWHFSRAFGLVHHCGLFPSAGVMILPSCSATANVSSIPLWKASWCSFSLVSSLLLASLM